MVDERDMSKEIRYYYKIRSNIAVRNFQRNHINAQYVSNSQEALSVVLKMISKGATVVRGDSVSLDQIGIITELRKQNHNRIVDPYERDANGCLTKDDQERFKMQQEAFFADVFLAGVNAITLDGKLVNTDAFGNRVAPILFGPEKVILIVGANKIVSDLNSALKRIREICAPINAKRHLLKHQRAEFAELPCVKSGKCTDCNHEWRICCSTVIIERGYAKVKGRINIILVGEELGI